MQKLLTELLAVSAAMGMLTAIAFYNLGWLGITGASMCYLMAVLAIAYRLSIHAALYAALAAFLLTNYFLVEPRFTFEVASAESWVALLAFLLVSIVVASLVGRLRLQTAAADDARRRAQFSRDLAEMLAAASDTNVLFSDSVAAISRHLQRPVSFVSLDAAGRCLPLCQSTDTSFLPEPIAEPGAVRWARENGKMLGPGTNDWPDSPHWIIPFSRLASELPVMLVARADGDDDHAMAAQLRLLADQVSSAYQRLTSHQQAHAAELRAREEAVQGALLASLSHDMRTPLTAILGAASTLAQQDADLGQAERASLLAAICSETRYLDQATTNILSLAALDGLKAQNFHPDWQSPEEVIGATLARYQGRPLPSALATQIRSERLIQADAVLLSQALANLIDNAITLQPSDEPILLSVAVEDARLVIAVHDRGPGFPAGFGVQDIAKFSRRPGQGRGFGLGLAIVQAIAALHGAELTIDPRPGGGSIVGLHFALAAEEPGRG